jgi:hypothetical protein
MLVVTTSVVQCLETLADMGRIAPLQSESADVGGAEIAQRPQPMRRGAAARPDPPC